VLCQLSYTPETIADFGLPNSDFQIRNPQFTIRNREGLVAGAGFEPATFGL
jgi:hypothetical protein